MKIGERNRTIQALEKAREARDRRKAREAQDRRDFEYWDMEE